MLRWGEEESARNRKVTKEDRLPSRHKLQSVRIEKITKKFKSKRRWINSMNLLANSGIKTK